MPSPEELPRSCYGLSFGNSSMTIASCGMTDHKTHVLANSHGERQTPSFICMTPGDNVTGTPAKQGMSRNGADTVFGVKRLLDNPVHVSSPVTPFHSSYRGKVTKEGGMVFFTGESDKRGTKHTLDEILVLLFQEMHSVGDSHRGGSGRKAEEKIPLVVAVPWTWGKDLRLRIKEAGTKAGFHVLQTISEPCAAALAFQLGQHSQSASGKCMVVRVGGQSSDVSVLDYTGGFYSILSQETSHAFHGDAVTGILCDHLAEDYSSKWGGDPRKNPRSYLKLLLAAENCKHVLSSMQTASCFLESLYEGIDFNASLSRPRLESLIAPYLPHLGDLLHHALTKANLNSSDIDTVILCGGGCRIPRIQSFVASQFPEAEVLGGTEPEAVLAEGASIEAAILCQHREESTCHDDGLVLGLAADVLSLSRPLLLQVDEEWREVFPAGSPVPSHWTGCVPAEGRQSVSLKAWEGKNGSLLSTMSLSGLAPESEIHISCHLQGLGSLDITAMDSVSNESVNCVIQASS